MNDQIRKLTALLTTNGGTINAIHRLANDLEEISGAFCYAEIIEAMTGKEIS